MDTDKQNTSLDFQLNRYIFAAACFFIAGFSFVGIVLGFRANAQLEMGIAEKKEESRPAELELTIIKDKDCSDCFSFDSFLSFLGGKNVTLEKEVTIFLGSAEADNLIKEYNIEKIPTLILSGEIRKEKEVFDVISSAGDISGDVFVLRQVGAPYVQVSSGEVRGRAEVIFLSDASCETCYNVQQHAYALQRLGVPMSNLRTIDRAETEGKELIRRYNISMLPTMIIRGDTEEYTALASVWSEVGTVENDSAYVFREGVKLMGIYRDLITNEIVSVKNNEQGNEAGK